MRAGFHISDSDCRLSFHRFENPAMLANDRKLICPQCGEQLTRADVESFLICPFCSHRFAYSVEMEDFLLEPEADSWMKRQPGFTFQILNQFSRAD